MGNAGRLITHNVSNSLNGKVRQSERYHMLFAIVQDNIPSPPDFIGKLELCGYNESCFQKMQHLRAEKEAQASQWQHQPHEGIRLGVKHKILLLNRTPEGRGCNACCVSKENSIKLNFHRLLFWVHPQGVHHWVGRGNPRLSVKETVENTQLAQKREVKAHCPQQEMETTADDALNLPQLMKAFYKNQCAKTSDRTNQQLLRVLSQEAATAFHEIKQHQRENQYAKRRYSSRYSSSLLPNAVSLGGGDCVVELLQLLMSLLE
mmetsp:Transcript_81457/g.141441  ORF Transcript_81457/g.141441 Transcript_81457/m.141441 type:complete len:262 (-) Transcript_81457:21-806(-)